MVNTKILQIQHIVKSKLVLRKIDVVATRVGESYNKNIVFNLAEWRSSRVKTSW